MAGDHSITSLAHDGKAELKIFTAGVAASANLITDANFPVSLPVTKTQDKGPILLRNPHATFVCYFAIGANPTAGNDGGFKLGPGESIMIPVGVTDLRVISDNANHYIHLLHFYRRR